MSVIDGTSANDQITPEFITTGVVGTPTAFPSDDDDELHGHAGNDLLVAGGGSDFLFGDDLDSERGNDTMDGGTGADFMFGHYGNDTYIVDNIGDVIGESMDRAGGIDTVRSQTISVILGNYDNGGMGLENISLFGTQNIGATGNSLANQILGNDGRNLLLGGGGNDFIDGLSGNDTVRGQGGDDTIRGGIGSDVLVGGLGHDTFQFVNLNGSTPAGPDQLSAGDSGNAFDNPGATSGDRIDVAGLDANTTTTGNQTFLFGGTTKGHLWLTDSGNDTIVRGNIDNDSAAEFQLVIHDGAGVHASAYTTADFIL